MRPHLSTLIKNVALADEAIYLRPAKIVSTDINNQTCTVRYVGHTFNVDGVLMQSVVGAVSGMVLVPKTDSWVTIGFLSADVGIIVQTSELDRVSIKIADSLFLIDENGITLNEGENGHLVIWNKLQPELEKLAAQVKALTDALTQWSPVPQDGGAALKALASGLLVGKQPPKFDGLDDKKVVH